MDALREAIEKSQGVLTIPMEDLRDAYGAERLGSNVRLSISKQLQSLGFGHYPQELPDRYWYPVRLYRLGTPIADLIDAVLNPNAADSAHDEELRRAVSGRPTEILRRIKELVCE